MRLLGIIYLSLSAFVQPATNAQERNENPCDSTVTQDLLQCASTRLSEADAQLNAAYKKKISSAGKKKEALRDVQLAWISFRDDYCNGIYEESRGGNEADIDKIFCLASLTEDRVVELDRIGKDNDETELFKVLRSLERAGYDRQEVLDRLASSPDGSKWRQYSDKNCAFLEGASGAVRTECLARLSLDRSY